ncbi:conjugal transfer protein TraB [Streptacidiphilus anmyonensis]|uniref:conjugal transfer protein TraB n=1 Tax=Streptacidiphilus anmyonensis TaxID=405782 RepID=UPI000A72EC90|nr:conjugal transfer protein TraB [Streptacidiphilus anmyonensis]
MSDDTAVAPSPAPAANAPAPTTGSGAAPAANAPVPAGGSGSSTTPAPTDADNRYKAVQHKLKAFAGAMDEATNRLGHLLQGMRNNADRARSLADTIANADLDPVFVEMTSAVSVALGGASVEVRKLLETAQDVTGLAEQTRVGHSKLYAALDEVRTGRKYRTPKPGFFNN